MKTRITLTFTILLILSSCAGEAPTPVSIPDRESLIPATQVKISPDTDIYPPKSLTNEYEDPIPLPYPINTTGAEDSAFMAPDGKTLYVWFTPDVSKPVEQQITDKVTGIYVFHRVGDGWSPAERVMLQDPGKLAGDGCEFVQGNLMLFCTVREGYTGIHWFSAEFLDGKWCNYGTAPPPVSHRGCPVSSRINYDRGGKGFIKKFSKLVLYLIDNQPIPCREGRGEAPL